MAKVTLTGYGQNQSAVPSTLTPGEDVEHNPYAPPLSDAHESIITNGVASNANPAKIDARPVAAGFGMRDRNADPATVPSAMKRK
jgi:hypothetical protein